LQNTGGAPNNSQTQQGDKKGHHGIRREQHLQQIPASTIQLPAEHTFRPTNYLGNLQRNKPSQRSR